MPTSWSLCTYRLAGGDDRAGVLRDDGTVVTPPVGVARHPGLLAVFDDWAAVSGELQGWDPSGAEVIEGAEVLAPLRFPRKLLCVGANYHDHIQEMGAGELGDSWRAFFFLKPPTTTVIGPGDTVLIDADPASRPDWEAELGVVIGHGGRDIAEGDALDHVAGYTMVNDVSARGPHRRPDAPPAFSWDWLESKCPDTFAPMGPGVVPAWLVDDCQDLTVKLWVNGDLKQDSNTSKMIIGVRELVAAASRTVTLEPGDVIATGTPAGVGANRKQQLHDGDEMVVEIAGLGRLVNPVKAR